MIIMKARLSTYYVLVHTYVDTFQAVVILVPLVLGSYK